jgi:hypothetical protein
MDSFGSGRFHFRIERTAIIIQQASNNQEFQGIRAEALISGATAEIERYGRHDLMDGGADGGAGGRGDQQPPSISVFNSWIAW